MRPDLDTLRAFADGDLPPEQRAEVEAAVAADTELAALTAAMQASRLPYRQAFAIDSVPPVPAALEARVAALASAALAAEEPAWAHAAQGAPATPTKGPVPPRNGLWWRLALVLPALAIGYLAALAIGAVQRPSTEPWLQSVITYQAMYSRDTVTDGGTWAGQVQLQAIRKVLQEQRGLDLRVPDLSAQNLQFVRAQRLQFNGHMVLQLIYLPSQGEPVALCLTPAPSQPERQITAGPQHALAWHTKGWAYVLIGSLPLAQLQSVRQQVRAPII